MVSGDSYKIDLEKRISELTSIYTEMLQELAVLHDSVEALKKEYQLGESNFNNMQSIADCVKGRLDTLKQNLNAVYNNEDYLPISKFQFSRDMVRTVENPDSNQSVK